MQQQINQKQFAEELSGRLSRSENPRLSALSEKDILVFFDFFWLLLAQKLRSKKRVIFEKWISFYTKPVKRSCFHNKEMERGWTFSYRLRFKPLANLQEMAQEKLTQEQYEQAKKEEDK